MKKKQTDTRLAAYKRKRNITKAATSVFRYAFLLAIAYIILTQIFYLISYAFRTPEDVYDASVVWLPKHFTFSNIGVAWKVMNYPKTFFTTVTILILSGLFEIVTCAVPAYGLARFKFKGKTVMIIVVMLMILLPPQMTAVSMSLNYVHFDVLNILKAIGGIFGKDIRPNLLDTGFVFWLPSLLGVGLRSGLFIFIYMQFFKGLPKELEEAAQIDGANALQTFIRVVMPSSGVAFLTVGIFSMVWHGNEYNQSILYFTDNYPMSVILNQLKTSMGVYTKYGLSSSPAYDMAACLLYVLPLLIMYIVLQRKFISSIDRVGIVG